MGYRPSSREPKGRWGIAIDRKLRDDQLSLSRAFELWHEGLGLSPRSRAVLDAIVHGQEPSPAQARYLTQLLDGEPSEAVLDEHKETAPPVGEVAELVALVRTLVEELRDERRARVEWEQGFLEAMRELAKGAAQQGDLAPSPPATVRLP